MSHFTSADRKAIVKRRLHIDPSLILCAGARRTRRAPDVYVDENHRAMLLEDVPAEELDAAIDDPVSSDDEEEGEEEADESDCSFVVEDDDVENEDGEYVPSGSESDSDDNSDASDKDDDSNASDEDDESDE